MRPNGARVAGSRAYRALREVWIEAETGKKIDEADFFKR
jgi:hypothetical protein